MNRIIDAIEKEQFKTDVTKFKIGDGIRVHTRVVEGEWSGNTRSTPSP